MLTLTSPIAPPAIASVAPVELKFRPDGVVTLTYREHLADGTGVTVKELVSDYPTVLAAMTGATHKAKLHNVLATLLGVTGAVT